MKWTREDDKFLLAYILYVGPLMLAEHDFNCTAAALIKRLIWLYEKDQPLWQEYCKHHDLPKTDAEFDKFLVAVKLNVKESRAINRRG